MKTAAWISLVISLVLTGLWVAGGLTGDDEFAWLNGYLAGPIVLIFVVPMLFTFSKVFGGAMAQLRGELPQDFAGAPIGMGTVVGVGRTGLSINDQPQLAIQLRVDTVDGRTFPATAKQIVDLTELGAVQPGAVLPVRYLPDGRVVLATDASQQELQHALDRIQLAKGLVTPNQLRISEQGVDAQAVVLAMVPTGEVRDGRTVAHVTLRVTRPNGTMFDLVQEKNLVPSAIPQVQPGMVVRVKYLPYDESEVAILTALNR
ncbi:hypothetical protein [Actinosynnema sp. NPDC020468]|uniref:hypothetical protein n=1 Tax=Actinosynnema sp. NPDC020468 TaxID=3154488 RepID=UPI0033C2939B